jgi:hypothetical protein
MKLKIRGLLAIFIVVILTVLPAALLFKSNNYEISWMMILVLMFNFLGTVSMYIKQKFNYELLSEELQTLLVNESRLKKIKKELSNTIYWESILVKAGIESERFEKTLKFYEDKEKNIDCLMQQLNVKNYHKEENFFRVYFNKSFDLNIDTCLLYITNDSVDIVKRDILDIDDKIIVISTEEYQKDIHNLARDRTNRIVAPTQEMLTKLLLENDSEDTLIKIFSECLLFKDLSPYQVNSGVNNESNFFGRVEIIRDIITKENANYLIVGARQLGKSSIIKALERRYEGSSKVDCYSFTMEDENIVLAMSRALGMEGEPTLDEVVSAIANVPKKSIFLIDEADRFVKHEKEIDYEVTEAFRKLSQEGKATFVLTGFWTLYFTVTSDYHSPLKNFGELIKLEGLDHDACRDLMIEPMKCIGVSYESESIVENVIEFCGRRPNLIAITCNEVLKNLGSCIEESSDENGRPCKRKVIKAESKRITQSDIDEVVENSSLEDYLKGWGSMSENEADNRLDRVIIYLTLEKESFRLADIDAWLKEQGKKIDANRIKSSLERLVVGYILQERKKNYSYRVPLFREKLLEDDIDILLDGDLEQL